MKFNNNEEAVSPVIGVILMVAITVILAAVIAVFVFGMADDIQTTYVINLNAKLVDGNVTAMYNGGSGSSSLSSIVITAYDGNGAKLADNFIVKGSSTTPFASGVGTWDSPKIGDTIKISGATAGNKLPANTRFVFVGKFTDGSEQVILDKQF